MSSSCTMYRLPCADKVCTFVACCCTPLRFAVHGPTLYSLSALQFRLPLTHPVVCTRLVFAVRCCDHTIPILLELSGFCGRALRSVLSGCHGRRGSVPIPIGLSCLQIRGTRPHFRVCTRFPFNRYPERRR